MSDRRWLEELRTESFRCGLPPEYVERLAAELSDHLVDLKEETMLTHTVCDDATIESRLGQPGRVARSAVEARQGGLLRRSRLAAFAVFAMLPVPLLALLWAVAGMLTYYVGQVFVFALEVSGRAEAVLDWLGEREAVTSALLRLAIAAAIAIPSAGLAAAYCRLSKKTGRSLLWATVGCLTVAAASGAVHHQVTHSSTEPGRGTVAVGIGIAAVSGWQLAQAAAPASVVLLFAWRTSRARASLAT